MTPEEVRSRRFNTVRKGYNPTEVLMFQEEVVKEMASLTLLVSELKQQVAEIREKARDDSDAQAEVRVAEAWRDEVLADLSRRRVDLNAEIVRMRAGRDVLRDAIAEAAGVLEEPLARLDAALREARAHGDLEAGRVREARRPGPEELCAELETASLAGFVPSPGARDEPQDDSPEAVKRQLSVRESQSEPSEGDSGDKGEQETSTVTPQLDQLFARARAEQVGKSDKSAKTPGSKG